MPYHYHRLFYRKNSIYKNNNNNIHDREDPSKASSKKARD